jgi:DNA-binding CsgD family transcriptional regulator
MLANQPSVVLCICSTARMSDLELLEQFSEANSQRRAMPAVLLMRKPNRACAEDGKRADKCSSVRMRLTIREKDVLTWVARGKTSAEIAIILGLSERTINFHCDKAMKRLDVINRTQAVAKAMAEGLIGI